MNTLLINCNSNCYDIKSASNIIKSGGIGIFPTDTVYGIGCNALNETAIRNLFNAKKRDLSNPINVLISDIGMVELLATNISNIEYKLMKAFWPGPFTIILNKKASISNILTSNLDTIGLRIPNNNICLDLIKESNLPIATSSANISGSIPTIEIDEQIKNNFYGNINFMIDGGKLESGVPSTIVKVNNNHVIILRNGPIKINDIKKVVGGDINVK